MTFWDGLPRDLITILRKKYVLRRNTERPGSKNFDIKNSFSYHDIHVTAEGLARRSIFNMSYGYEISCTRSRGWTLWYMPFSGELKPKLVGGEYEGPDKWLVIDVDGFVIVDSRKSHLEQLRSGETNV